MIDHRNVLENAVRNAARLLPPHVVGAPFVYENPLRAFEDWDFDEAVIEAAQRALDNPARRLGLGLRLSEHQRRIQGSICKTCGRPQTGDIAAHRA